ncbi:MAG: universal stress protein [bacterium]|nr:universal stress protein [bacterium]
MYRHILVATGGSPWSEAAVGYAVVLAAQTGAVLKFLTVLTVEASYSMPDIAGASELVLDSIEREGEALLRQAAAQATQAGVAHTTQYAWGNIPQTILHTATETACDLIVLGSRGTTGWKRLMLGNISNAVAAKAQQPTLLVKQLSSSMPLKSPWRRVLVATGGSPWSDTAVDHALQLAHNQQFEVCLLHVERRRRRGEDPAAAESKNILSLAETRAAAAGVPYHATLASGDIVEAILETAMQKQCDAIIVGSRGLTGWKRLMLGSISNAVAAKTQLPVLIVKRFLGA